MPTTTLTTYTKVQARMGWSGTTGQTEVNQILPGVTKAIERFCKRTLLRVSGKTEYFTGNGGEVLQLSVYPVESITSVTLATDRDFANGDVLVAEDDYRFDPETGLLYRESGIWSQSRRSIQVVYTGGYVHPDDTPTTGQYELPADVIEAAIQQTIALYNRRKNPEMQGEKAGDGTVTFLESGLLPIVEQLLQPYVMGGGMVFG